MAIIFITHDLGVIAQIADYVVVMYLGRVMETGPVDDIFHRPQHPYTRALLESIPTMYARSKELLPTIVGSIPHPLNRPARLSVLSALRRLHAGNLRHGPAGPAAGQRPAVRQLLSLSQRGRSGLRSHVGRSRFITRQPPILEIRHLKKYFPIRKGMLRKVVGQVRAVDDVSFSIAEGETLGLVGESGCGKTTTARCILRALDPSDGQILFRTKAGDVVDVATLPERDMRPLRREMQMIFQDPYAALNPRMNLLDIVGEPLLVIDRMTDRAQRTERVAALLRLVGLRPEYMHRFPHAFSGGQRQRIVIARALALHPRLVVADEAVSALDVSVQAQVLNLMLELQRELQLTYLFVAHDLGVVKHICDRVVVMYVGKIVEMAPTEELYRGAEASLHRSPDVGRAGGRPTHPLGHDAAPGRGPEPGQSAVRLLLPSPLSPRRRDLRQAAAGAGGDRARPFRQLPSGPRAGLGRHRRGPSPRSGSRRSLTSGGIGAQPGSRAALT